MFRVPPTGIIALLLCARDRVFGMARPLHPFALKLAKEVRHLLALVEQVHSQAQVRQESHIRLVVVLTLRASHISNTATMSGFVVASPREAVSAIRYIRASGMIALARSDYVGSPGKNQTSSSFRILLIGSRNSSLIGPGPECGWSTRAS